MGDNTAVSLLREEDGHMEVVFRDDNSHLRMEAYLAGEKGGKRANGLEPGLYFEPLRLPEQSAFLTGALRRRACRSVPGRRRWWDISIKSR